MTFSKYERAHFRPPTDADGFRALFKNSVTNVVIEITSYCNRVCTYCPVSMVDRKSENILLDIDVFQRIISDLRSINYAEGVCLNLYNEPMSDRPLLIDRITAVRRALPDARIYFSTNGDYLNQEYLKELVDAGLNELYVSVHTPPKTDYDDAYAMTRFTDLARRMNKAIKIDTIRAGDLIHGHTRVFGIPVYVFANNYYKIGTDRAGALDMPNSGAAARVSPCGRPFHDFTISYDGTVFPCCQMFVDLKIHKDSYAIGHISEFASIFEAYGSSVMAQWRRSLLTFSPKATPCASCSLECRTETPEEASRLEGIYRELADDGEPAQATAPPAPMATPRYRDRLVRLLWGR